MRATPEPMNPATPTIWMNVTTSASWTGAPMGIVRVERCLEDGLAALLGERFKRCVWRDGDFEEWTPPPRAPGGSSDRSAEEEAWVVPLLPRRQALVGLGQALLSLAPAALRPAINRGLQLCRPKDAAQVAGDARRDFVSPAVGKLFRPGDVLLSVGLDWDHAFPAVLDRLRRQRGVRIVTCCYDLIPVLYPQYCAEDMVGLFTRHFLNLARGSDLVLCISRQSERDFLGFVARHGMPAPATCVFPLGDNVPDGGSGAVSPQVRALCEEPFILFVSTIERRKNHEVLYRAYHLLCAEGRGAGLPKLVFVGMPGWGVQDFLKDVELDPLTRDLVVVLNRVTDAELAVLYRHARFCVFPSFYEGWGLPVGEALAMGKAVLSSDRGSLVEAGGQFARYVDPWNPRAWAEAIHDLATDPDSLSRLENEVRAGYEPRRWDDAALAVKAAIEALPPVGGAKAP